MASITLTDSLSAEILTANPQATSGFAKYLKGPAAQLVAGTDFVNQFRRELTLVSPGDGGFTLAWGGDVPIGDGDAVLKIAAGASAIVSVFNRPNMELLEDPTGGGALKVKMGQAFVAFAFKPTLAIKTSKTSGRLSFGFEAGGEAQWRFFQPFPLTGEVRTLGSACQELLETSVFPSTVDDLRALATLPPGSMASMSGSGQLQVSVAMDVATALNPLASLDTLGRIGPVTVSAGASASVGVDARVFGDFEVRAQTVAPGKVRLSYHRLSGREMTVTLEGSAGPGVSVGDRNVLEMLFGRPQGTGSIEEQLAATGITKKQQDKMIAVLKAGLSRKVEVAVAAGFSSLRQNEAAFCYDIDVAALDAAGTAAVNKALSGNLSELTSLETSLAGHGVALVRSRTEELRQKTVRWRLNLLGLVNVLSMTELVAKGTILHDEESGEVVIADEATRNSVGATTKGKELRRLLYQSLMLTVTYKAGLMDQNTGLKAAQSYFKIEKEVNRQQMSDFLDAVAALGLMKQEDIDGLLGATDDFGRGSLLIDVEYDQAACERMFLAEGKARSRDDYEDVGKLALLNLVQKDDVDAYRRVPLESATLWQRMRNNVSSDFGTILPPPVTSGSDEARKLHVGVVTADYIMIVWWAEAMATAAERIAKMREFLATPGNTPDETNTDFMDRRRKVSAAMVEVVRKSPSTYGGDPWGLIALLYASKRSGTATAALISANLTVALP
jgi:hypothetical protein